MKRLTIVAEEKGNVSLATRAELVDWLSEDRGPVALVILAPAAISGLNRLFGHEAGDALLGHVSHAAHAWGAVGGIAARLSGAKFAVAVPAPSHGDAYKLGTALVGAIEKAVNASSVIAETDIRIGAAWFEASGPKGVSADDMITTTLEVFDGGGRSAVGLEVAIVGASDGSENDFALARGALTAIRAGDVEAAFQPVVDAAGTGRVLFREALVRARLKTGELLTAGRFMPALERLGFAEEIDIIMLHKCFDALEEDERLRLSVNLSSNSVSGGRWLRAFDARATTAPQAAERLIVEITEEAAMADASAAFALISVIRARGTALALDDFGAGRTSFRQLRDFRFDIVKIDGGFVRGVDASSDNQMLIAALVGIARQFDMMVVAEFVETAAEARVLRKLGVDSFQGFLFGAPALVWSDGEQVSVQI